MDTSVDYVQVETPTQLHDTRGFAAKMAGRAAFRQIP